ncbi:MAG TPA: hypothetical protein VGR37_07505 [Longimicrobiaceae bacterium]|nr:hypothetical protein [Longimicrobiaceae bacterium]
MAATGIFIIVGTAIGLIRALPQLLRLVRTQDAQGVSADSAGTISVVSFAWAAYGMLTDQVAVALASGASAVMFGIVTAVALRLGRRVSEMRTTPVWLIVLAFAGSVGGAQGLGLLLPVSVLVANVPQLLVAWRERDLSGLSLGTWVLSVAEAAVWGTYGLLAGDRAILVHNVLHLTTSGGIVLLRLAKTRRLGQEALAGYP